MKERVIICCAVSSAYEWIGLSVRERIWLRERKKRVEDATEPRGTPLLIRQEEGELDLSTIMKLDQEL